jgi:hypothetical protein
MKTPDKPPILYGAVLLAIASLAWSGYAITDLMHSGRYGLSVALAGDIGWITVLWAEYRGVTIAGRRWPAPLAGWVIAAGVSLLLIIHGAEASRGQAIAGPFVVLVGKIVWMFALAAMRDPAAPTPEQQAEVHAVMRDSAHASALIHARAQAKIAQIRAEAGVTLARDETDFEIGLQRMDKQAELHRRTPLALPPNTLPEPQHAAPPAPDFDEVAEQAIEVIGEPEQSSANTLASTPSTVREQIANRAVNSPNGDREQSSSTAPNNGTPAIADVVREQVRRTANNVDAIAAVMKILPDANKESVAASVRRERRKSDMKGGYG